MKKILNLPFIVLFLNEFLLLADCNDNSYLTKILESLLGIFFSFYFHSSKFIKYKLKRKDAGVNFKTNIQCAIHTMEKRVKRNFTLEDASIAHLLKVNPRKYAEELSKHFHYSNGSCYYLPPPQSRKTWHDSKTYCENIGTNTYSSLYSYAESLEYEFVLKLLESYYEKSKARADISFNIGLNYSNHSKI